MRRVRVGIIGFGFIGSEIYRLLDAGDNHLELAFVHARNPSRLVGVAPEFICSNLRDCHKFSPDLVVECAHPDITVEFGTSFLECADYMPLSVTALAREEVLAGLDETTRKSHRRLFIPSGALVGTDSLYAWRHMWRDVTITFRKHPRNIDFALIDIAAESIVSETVIYDGPVRGIASLFPRNVNTMVTCALATIGVDRCRGRLVADPTLNEAVAEIEAWGKDGSYLSSVKRQPAIGVSGTEMFQSTLRSIRKAAGVWAQMDFV